MSDYPDFAHLLNRHLGRRDRSSAWLARQLKLHPGTVTRWITEHKRPGQRDYIVKIADLLKLEVSERNELLRAAGYADDLFHERVLPMIEMQDAHQTLASLPIDVIPDFAPLPSLSRIPFRANPLFVGRRDELRTLTRQMQTNALHAVGCTVAVTGLGGVGKTQLAVEFAHRYGQYFAGGVFWLTMEDADAVRTQVAACGPLLSEHPGDFEQLELAAQVRQVVRAWQSPIPRLLIFDNCEDQNLLNEWRPTTGGCRILLTSRHGWWSPSLDVEVVPLSKLLPAQSVELLCRFRTDLDPENPLIAQIAHELDHLPLALHLAGSYLARYQHAITPADYLEQLRSSPLLNHPSMQGAGASPTQHDLNVARTIHLSYQQLDTRHPIDRLARLLLCCAVHFAPGLPIPRELLQAALQVTEKIDHLQGADAIHRLLAEGLVEEQKDGSILLHQLVAQLVLGVHGPDRVQLSQRESGRDDDGEGVHHLLAQAQTSTESALLCKATCLNDLGHSSSLRAWQGHFRHVTRRAQARQDSRAASLCDALGTHLHLIGELAAAHAYLQWAWDVRQQQFGDAHPETAQSYFNMGRLLRAQGQLEDALPLLQRALEIRQQFLGECHTETAQSLNHLGGLLRSMGKYDEALRYIKRAIDIRLELFGETHHHTAHSFNNMAQLLQEMKRFEEARAYCQCALRARQMLFGDQHPHTAQSLHQMGRLLHEVNEQTEAQLYYEQALTVRRTILGARHPFTAYTLFHLGRLLCDKGEADAARAHLSLALEIMEERLGPSHANTEAARQTLAAIASV